ncbi:hypothetical protein M5K25_001956 [Dendrobium thyrsiflorum]|uniref:DUF4283 domain-containing protein n=1 Tax=Dendrobium thyrsiflorum TaxID=117978 RepID=A0ABD0VRU6_DENTH
MGKPWVADDRRSRPKSMSPSFVENSKVDLKKMVFQNLESDLQLWNQLEPSLASSKEIEYVEGKGKAISISLGNVTPTGKVSCSPFDPEASSSGLKNCVKIFGNSNAIPGHNVINANSLNLVNSNVQSLDDGREAQGAAQLSDDIPSLDIDSGLNPWRSKPYISLNFKEVDVVLSDDVKAIKLNEELEISNSKRLSKALVIKVFGKDIPSHMVAWEIRRQWSQFSQFHFTSLGRGWFLCSFNSELMMEASLSGGPWFVNGHIVGMERWTTDFSSSSKRGLTSPIWIRMPHLPLHCWEEDNVSRITSRISEPLMLDGNMFHWGRREFARVCVRVKLDEPLPLKVWVDSIAGRFFQIVEYEKISNFFFDCGMIGHVKEDCGKRKPLPDGVKFDAIKNGGGAGVSCMHEEVEATSYGPWILVNNKVGRNMDHRLKRGKPSKVYKGNKGVKVVADVRLPDKVALGRVE